MRRSSIVASLLSLSLSLSLSTFLSPSFSPPPPPPPLFGSVWIRFLCIYRVSVQAPLVISNVCSITTANRTHRFRISQSTGFFSVFPLSPSPTPLSLSLSLSLSLFSLLRLQISVRMYDKREKLLPLTSRERCVRAYYFIYRIVVSACVLIH